MSDRMTPHVRAQLNRLASRNDPDDLIERMWQHAHSNRRWLIVSGFALVATLAGLVVAPASLTPSTMSYRVPIASPVLAPEEVDELEMLSVLGDNGVDTTTLSAHSARKHR